jgi:magnesium chelatase family protein
MIAQVHSAVLAGIDALPVVVEADLQGGAPGFYLVGLAEKAVQESYQRFVSAIRNSGMVFPMTKIVVNLAPGDVRKEGTAFDLPIALSILAASGQVPIPELEGTLVLGELGLEGLVRPVDGAVSAAILAHSLGLKRLIVPEENAAEAAVVPGLEVFGVKMLEEAVALLNGSLSIAPTPPRLEGRDLPRYEVDYSDVKGQKQAIRALEIAAAGAHNILMNGPPGSGKTMLARRLPTILPPLSLEESIEVTRIYSAGGAKGGRQGLIWERPFRSPHHTASYAALIGGGRIPKPGEVTLSHLGVLFLDEMPEYPRDVLEALRQPLEDAVVTVSRVQSSLTFPANMILVGAMNPCPCGFKGYPEAKCVGAANCEKYAGRLSGPLLDRIDLHIMVPRLKPDELIDRGSGEPSSAIRERVTKAREVQHKRLGHQRTNSGMTSRELKELIVLDEAATDFMKKVSIRMNLSGRVFDRLLKVGRTIADLEGSEKVLQKHLAEAAQYRGSAGV